MIAAAETHQINPLVMLVRVQLEQSLVGKKTATQTALDWAMGCGCPDNLPCNPRYQGFDKQIDCMAGKFRSYLDDIAQSGKTIAGWGPGITKTSLEGQSVKPENSATASIYTYTPWVSSAENHVKIWSKYKNFISYVPSAPPVTNPGTDPGEDPGEDPPPGPVAVDIVVDSNDAQNGNDARFSASTSWTVTSSTPGYYGTDYAYRSTGATADTANFEFNLPQATSVTLEAWWTAGTNRSTTAPFLVYDAQGTLIGTQYVNQQQGGGAWMPLGSFALGAGWNRVSLSRWTTSGYVVIADAVRVRTE
jgi:hypothetical protein